MSTQRPRPAAESGIHSLSIAQRKFLSGFKIGPLGLIWNAMQHAEHRVILAENTADRGGGIDAQRLEFAQQKQSDDVIEIGIGERDAGNGRMAHALARMQFRHGLDLSSQVRRGTQQEPRVSVLRDRNLRLRARLAVECARSHGAAIMAGAVPLRKRATGRGTENLYLHLWRVYSFSQEPQLTTKDTKYHEGNLTEAGQDDRTCKVSSN